MLNSPDFKDLLNLFRDGDVRFLVIGGYAMLLPKSLLQKL